jgi:hypothetical protein
VPKLVWRVKLVAEFETGETTEVEVAHLERDEQAGVADLGLRLGEAKRLTAAIQAEIVPAQVTIAGEDRRTCVACGRGLASKGHYNATFRSLFGDVPIRVRRLLACSCRGTGKAKSFATFDLEATTVAPELAYVTARYAALAPFGKVAELLSKLLPVGGTANAGTGATEPCGPVRPLCCRMSRQRRSRANPSWLDLMAATSAAGTAKTSGILR